MKKLLFIVYTALMLTACGSYQQTVQVQDRAYLLLIGDPSGSVVTIDNNKPLELGKDTSSYDLNGEKATKIQISIGTHTVTVTTNGVLKVNRKFYVSTGNNFEVRLQ